MGALFFVLRLPAIGASILIASHPLYVGRGVVSLDRDGGVMPPTLDVQGTNGSSRVGFARFILLEANCQISAKLIKAMSSSSLATGAVATDIVWTVNELLMSAVGSNITSTE